MSEYLKKRNRSKSKVKSYPKSGKKNFNKKNQDGNNKNFAIKFSRKAGYEKQNEYVEKENASDELISENLIKIGKFWDSKNVIEPKNTLGSLEYIENYNNTNENYTLSIVGDSLHIFNSNDFSIKKVIKHPEEQVISFTYNEIRKEIICCMNNSLVRIFDMETVKCVKVWKLNKIAAKMMKIDPSYKFVAIVGSNHSILVYDLNNYNLINSFNGHDTFIYDIAFNPDKEKYILYSGSEDGTVKIWDIVLNKNIGILEGHSNGVRHVKLTNDGRSLISITTDNNIYVWKLSNQGGISHSLLKTIPFYKSISSVLYFTRASHVGSSKELIPSLLVGCEDGSINEVNLKSGKHNENKSISFVYQPIIQIFYSVHSYNLHLFTTDQIILSANINLVNDDVSKAVLKNIYPGFCQEVLDVKFLTGTNENSKNLRYFFSSNDNTLKYCSSDQYGKTNVKIIQGHEDFIMGITIKNNFISTASKDGTVRIWKWELKQFTQEDSEYKSEEFICEPVAVLKGHSEAVNTTTLILKNGEFKVVSGSKDMSLKIWDFKNSLKTENSSNEGILINESLYSQMAHDDEINLVKVSPNEKIIASGSYDKTIKIWNTQLKLLGNITGHKRAITDLAFSKYAKVLASCSTDKTIKIWNLNDYSCLNTFEGHLSSVLRIHWIYYGTHIISAGADGLVKFWNLKTSECLNTINAHEGKIWALDVMDEAENKTSSANENGESDGITKNLNNFKFITGGTDSKITIWTDITAQKETETLKNEEEKILKSERLKILNDNKEYYEAMRLALDLNHKSDFMSILKNFINDNLKIEAVSTPNDQISVIINNRKYLDEQDLDSSSFGKLDYTKLFKEKLNKILKDSEFRKIIMDNIDKVLEISRDNNIRASAFLYAQIILKLILISTNFEDFLNKNSNKKLGLRNKALKRYKTKQLPQTIDYIENFEIVKSYSQKHLERINRELTKSFLIDHVLEKMKII